MKEEFYGYLKYKGFQSMIFDDNKDNKRVYISKLTDIQILNNFLCFIKACSNKSILDDISKYNIVEICDGLRNIEDEHRITRIEITNEIYRLINSQSIDNSNMFYANEIYKRFNEKEKNISYQLIEDIKGVIRNSLCTDLIILASQSSYLDISEDKFDLEFLNNFSLDELYIHSVFAILYDLPQLYDDNTFLTRTKKVINKKMDNCKNNCEKRSLKKIKKMVNRIIENNNEER